MLKTRLLHPGILQALGESGHGAQVLIADGNYPLRSGSNEAAHRVYLNLAPGTVTCCVRSSMQSRSRPRT
jgi:L-fucose mutarotase